MSLSTTHSAHVYHRKTRPLPQCNTDDIYTPMMDLSQSVLGLLSFVVAKRV